MKTINLNSQAYFCYGIAIRFIVLVAALSLATTAWSDTASPTSLENTSWQLVKFVGGDDTTLTPDEKAKYTIAFGSEGRVHVRFDCNRGTGAWKSAGPNQLEFGMLALTRAMCPPGSLHDRMAKDWNYVRSYVMKDGHLFLSLMADAGVYEFEPLSDSKASSLKSPVSWNGPVKFTCTSTGHPDQTLSTSFYKTTPALALLQLGTETRPAFQVEAASGAKYEGDDLLFWDAHGEATLKWSGLVYKCKPLS